MRVAGSQKLVGVVQFVGFIHFIIAMETDIPATLSAERLTTHLRVAPLPTGYRTPSCSDACMARRSTGDQRLIHRSHPSYISLELHAFFHSLSVAVIIAHACMHVFHMHLKLFNITRNFPC